MINYQKQPLILPEYQPLYNTAQKLTHDSLGGWIQFFLIHLSLNQNDSVM